jgi:hypothetical protein
MPFEVLENNDGARVEGVTVHEFLSIEAAKAWYYSDCSWNGDWLRPRFGCRRPRSRQTADEADVGLLVARARRLPLAIRRHSLCEFEQ